MPIYSLDGITPVVAESAFVHPSAVLIGDAIVGEHCYIGPNAVMRGDFGRLILDAGSNLQDTCVMHGFPGIETRVEENGHIGHGAVLHGCRIGRNSLVGMNAVIMDESHIEAESIVSACAFVKARFTAPPRSLIVGSPAKVLREVSDQELEWKTRGTEQYQQLARRSLSSLVETLPLRQLDENRPTFDPTAHAPIYKHRD